MCTCRSTHVACGDSKRAHVIRHSACVRFDLSVAWANAWRPSHERIFTQTCATCVCVSVWLASAKLSIQLAACCSSLKGDRRPAWKPSPADCSSVFDWWRCDDALPQFPSSTCPPTHTDTASKHIAFLHPRRHRCTFTDNKHTHTHTQQTWRETQTANLQRIGINHFDPVRIRKCKHTTRHSCARTNYNSLFSSVARIRRILGHAVPVSSEPVSLVKCVYFAHTCCSQQRIAKLLLLNCDVICRLAGMHAL